MYNASADAVGPINPLAQYPIEQKSSRTDELTGNTSADTLSSRYELLVVLLLHSTSARSISSAVESLLFMSNNTNLYEQHLQMLRRPPGVTDGMYEEFKDVFEDMATSAEAHELPYTLPGDPLANLDVDFFTNMPSIPNMGPQLQAAIFGNNNDANGGGASEGASAVIASGADVAVMRTPLAHRDINGIFLSFELLSYTN